MMSMSEFVDTRTNTSLYVNICRQVKEKKQKINSNEYDLDDVCGWFEWWTDLYELDELKKEKEIIEKEWKLWES